ncbi:ribosome-associated protein YbcJ [Serratia marcescens]|nr:ribosome-associated protein YbcJ [Serratia marcescens]
MEIFNLDNHPHVELCDLLKFQGWCESGGAAKEVIAEGRVRVDGKVETRKRCKIVADQVVEFNGGKVMVKP